MTVVRLVAAAALVAVVGCAERSVPEDQATERSRAFAQPSPAPAPAAREELAGPERRAVRDATRTANLSPEQNEVFFRDFEDYLRRPGRHHGDAPARVSTWSQPRGATSRSPPRRNSHRANASLSGDVPASSSAART